MRSLEEVKKLSKDAAVVPIYKELLADLETPISAFLKISQSCKDPFLLESVEGGEKIARFSFLGKNPFLIFSSRGKEIRIRGAGEKTYQGNPLDELKKIAEGYKSVPDPALPNFSGGGVGYIAYDAIRLIENIPDSGEDSFKIDDIQMGFYDSFIAFDNVRHKMLLVSNVIPSLHGGVDKAYVHSVSKISELEKELAQGLPHPMSVGTDKIKWESNFKQADFEKAVNSCKEYVFAGDAFQIVLSQRFSTEVKTPSLQIYRSLRTINPSPYMYFLRFGELEIVGASPEMLVRVNANKVESRPIAGSRPRGKTEAEDTILEKELLADEKEKAEHLMLVDLGRNDVGRVSEYGSVGVPQFMTVEKYSHIMHIVSSVTGNLRPGMHCIDAMMACFPAGTLSGAPKIRAMQIIDELEPHKRGVYGGAICYLDFNGNMDSCIAIRTLVLINGKAYVQAGAGLVADSVPETEFVETMNKAAALKQAVESAGDI